MASTLALCKYVGHCCYMTSLTKRVQSLSDKFLVASAQLCCLCPREELVARTAGGKLARTHAHSDGASEEEEDWYDASEDVEEEAPTTIGSWWEQDNVDAADVESHLLKDIHQKGMLLNTAIAIKHAALIMSVATCACSPS